MQLPFATTLATVLSSTLLSWPWSASSPSTVVERVLSKHPVLDGHYDLPVVARIKYGDDVRSMPYNETLWGQVDIPRLRRGHVGGFWSIAYVPCSAADNANDFTTATNQVRDTMEQLDVTHQLASVFPKDVAITRTPAQHRDNVKAGKISHWIGVEGGHSLGNSLATLRAYANLGATYLTLTHTCHNAFADSCTPSRPLHNGLSQYGRRLVQELNRLGVAVDISHTSTETQRQAIQSSRAPVVFSHSGAAAIHNHPRNIQDEILTLLKGREVVIGVPFVAEFVLGPGKSTLDGVVRHIEHIASILGKDKVALGSDFDGAFEFAAGLNDPSFYPNLFIELQQRGWSERELAGLASENFLRVYEKIQAEGQRIRAGATDLSPLPDMTAWEGRDVHKFL